MNFMNASSFSTSSIMNCLRGTISKVTTNNNKTKIYLTEKAGFRFEG